MKQLWPFLFAWSNWIILYHIFPDDTLYLEQAKIYKIYFWPWYIWSCFYIYESAMSNLLLPHFLVKKGSVFQPAVLKWCLITPKISLHITSDITDGKTYGIPSSAGDTVAQSHISSTILYLFICLRTQQLCFMNRELNILWSGRKSKCEYWT